MSTHTHDPADAQVSAGSSAARTGPSGTPPRRIPWYAVLLLALVAAALARSFVVETFFVPDDGMAPTLAAGDRVLVLKAGASVARGDVVVVDVSRAFAGPSRATHEDSGPIGSTLSALADSLGVHNGSRAVVARVVAVGGDVVTCSAGRLVVGATPVSGDVGCDAVTVTVPAGSLWVLGDHPAAAFDSWAHVTQAGQGLVGTGDVVGSVDLRWWPLAGLGPLTTRVVP